MYVLQSSLVHNQNSEDVKSLTICVDTTDSPAALIGEKFWGLRQLVLTDSILSSLRDLGTRLVYLEFLDVSKCRLSDFDGITGFPRLQKLIAKHNNISEVSQLAMHDSLEVVELDGNAISEETELVHLSMCPRLRVLSIVDNPITNRDDVESLISTYLPSVSVRHTTPPAAAMKAADSFMSAHPPLYDGPHRASAVTSFRAVKCHTASSGGSSFGRPTTAEGDGDSLTSASTWDRAESSTANSIEGPRTPRRGSKYAADSSSLTFGQDSVVFAGSAVLSMRRRRVSGALASPAKHAAAALDMTTWVKDASDDGLIPTAKQRPFSAIPAMSRSPTLQKAASGLSRNVSRTSHDAPALASFTSQEESFVITDEMVCPDSPKSLDSTDDKSLSILAVLDEAKREDAARRKEMAAGVQEWKSASQSPAKPPHATEIITPRGPAVGMTDNELIEMLKAKPKHVPQLHSRESFRKFFSGISQDRMTKLLRAAYMHLPPAEQAEKVEKRIELLSGVMT